MQHVVTRFVSKDHHYDILVEAPTLLFLNGISSCLVEIIRWNKNTVASGQQLIVLLLYMCLLWVKLKVWVE